VGKTTLDEDSANHNQKRKARVPLKIIKARHKGDNRGLSLNKGVKETSMKIEFFRHNIEEEDIREVSSTLRSIFLTTGPVVADFEKRFSEYVGFKEVVCVNSCTAALHLSLLGLNIGQGDEVITTPMTFIATATAIMHTGAKPVFVDVEEDTGLMDINKVEQAISRRTKAILPVHLYGSMVDMKALRRIADRHNLKVVEDCAHCIEAERDEIRPGELGDAACYSFYATKNLTCGEGGCIATNDLELAAKLKILRTHGMSKDAATRYAGRYRHWDMVLLGWKHNMDDIHAALLIKQLYRLERYLIRRQNICRLYDAGLAKISNIRIPQIRGNSARHLYTIWVDPKKRDEVIHKLQNKDIGVAVNYRAIHNLTFFREQFGFKPENFPIANNIGESTLTLPLYPKLSDNEVEYVIKTVKKAVM
jgi:dTDP-4-amino-4,6-dideoxygalactose transaminase